MLAPGERHPHHAADIARMFAEDEQKAQTEYRIRRKAQYGQ